MSRLTAGSGSAARTRRASGSQLVSATLFTAILVAFAFPFATVSCNGPPVQFTAYELAIWRVPQSTPPATTDEGGSLPEAIESEAAAWALLALLAAAVGVALGLAGRRGGGIATGVGLLGVGGLFWASFDVLGPEVRYEAGYAGTAILFAVAAVWHAGVAIRRRVHRGVASTHPPVRLPGL